MANDLEAMGNFEGDNRSRKPDVPSSSTGKHLANYVQMTHECSSSSCSSQRISVLVNYKRLGNESCHASIVYAAKLR